MAKNEQDAAPIIGLTQEQLAQLIANVQPQSPLGANATEFATALATALEDAQMKWKPHEKKVSDGKSVYNPEGERISPNPKLKCHIYSGSYPIGDPRDNKTLTRKEVEALNTLTPGYFRIKKLDRTEVVIEIKGQVNANQEIERLWILYPAGDSQKNLYPPIDELCLQCNDANRTSNPLVAA